MNLLNKERKTIYHMINIYCKAHHGKNINTCSECKEFWNYANKRLDFCPYGEEKPNCKLCPIHCYKPDMQEYAKKVMGFSGPRMYKHPILGYHYLKNQKRKIPPLITKKSKDD